MTTTATQTTVTCRCGDCRANGARPVLVPDTFAPTVDRKRAAHGIVWQANHPVLGGGFRAQTGITLV